MRRVLLVAALLVLLAAVTLGTRYTLAARSAPVPTPTLSPGDWYCATTADGARRCVPGAPSPVIAPVLPTPAP